MRNALSTGAQDNGGAAAFHALTHQQTATLVAITVGLLALLWLRARWHRAQLTRSYNRAMRNMGVSRQLRGIRRNHVMPRAGSTRRAVLAFRKALTASLALTVVLIWVQAKAGR